MSCRSLAFFGVILMSCSSTPKRQQGDQYEKGTVNEKLEVSSTETFDRFYKRFSLDSAYQVSHITFPLQLEAYDADDNITVSTMNAREWGYMSFDLKKPYILKINSAKDTTKVNIQIEDTGAYTDYFFTIVNSKWMLVKIVDRST